MALQQRTVSYGVAIEYYSKRVSFGSTDTVCRSCESHILIGFLGKLSIRTWENHFVGVGPLKV